MTRLNKIKKKIPSSFTLIELLIVVGITAILAVAVVLAINPIELLRRARDSARLSDLGSIQRALGLYQANVADPSMGSPNVLYLSLPDPAATSSAGTNCQSLGLPSLPAAWSYHCASPSDLKNTDGTGWIPVDLSQMASAKPLATYPVDPTNTSSSGSYFAYGVSGGRWELTGILESNKYSPLQLADEGADLAKYEIGQTLSAIPFSHQFAGYWNFDEGSGSIAQDSSGYNSTGTLTNGPTWTTGKAGGALNFDGINDSVSVGTIRDAVLTENGPTTISLWIYPTGFAVGKALVTRQPFTGFTFDTAANGQIRFFYQGVTNIVRSSALGAISLDQWSHIALTWTGSTNANSAHIFVNGEEVSYLTTQNGSGLFNNSFGLVVIGNLHLGKIDDVRIYAKALTATQIKAIYEKTK